MKQAIANFFEGTKDFFIAIFGELESSREKRNNAYARQRELTKEDYKKRGLIYAKYASAIIETKYLFLAGDINDAQRKRNLKLAKVERNYEIAELNYKTARENEELFKDLYL